MEKNKRMVKIALILIVISLVFSIGFAFYLKLDDKVFLKRFSELDIPIIDDTYGEQDFTLTYITNINDDNRVLDIFFKEEPKLRFYANEQGFVGSPFLMFENNPYKGEVYGRYAIRTVYIRLDGSNIRDKFEKKELNNAQLTLDNGKVINVDIGRIILHGDNKRSEVLTYEGGSSSSDGSASSDLIVYKDITIEKLDSPFMDYIKDIIDLSPRDLMNISGIKYKAGDKIHIRSEYNDGADLDILSKYTTYNNQLRLLYNDDDGNSYNSLVHYIDSPAIDFNFKEIFKYLKARGEI